MADNLRVRITKTKREWKIVDKRIKELSADVDLTESERYNRYLNNKISLLINDYEKHPDSIKNLFPPRNPERQKSISAVWHERLCKISTDTGVSISTIIDKIIITPLLIEK